MIRCKELGKDFGTHEEMFAELKKSREAIIDLKKSTIKSSDPIAISLRMVEITKGEKKELSYGDHIYPVMNTTNYFDSHNDVHIDGIWDKSAKDQNGKVYYIINHDLAIGKVISYPKDVEVMVKKMFWTELGKDYSGQTDALIFKSRLTERSNEDAYKAFKAGEPIQNSIRMQYVSIQFAVNSAHEDYKMEKAIWDKYYPVIVNKDDAEASGYFWAVTEAKIYKEGSAVLFGSNDATPVLYEQPKSITQNEPPVSTHQEPISLIKHLQII